MKVNEAPEKIYFTSNENGTYYTEGIPFERECVEYIRIDTFIEKALEFLDGCIPDYIDLEHANVDTFMNIDNKRFIEDFKNYMKGERYARE